MNHEEPIPMTIMEGKSAFYACSKYMLKDEKHPDGHEANERACANRISFQSMMRIMEKFMKIVEADDAAGTVCDYTGMKFKSNGVDVKILKYDPSDMRIGILNRKDMRISTR